MMLSFLFFFPFYCIVRTARPKLYNVRFFRSYLTRRGKDGGGGRLQHVGPLERYSWSPGLSRVERSLPRLVVARFEKFGLQDFSWEIGAQVSSEGVFSVLRFPFFLPLPTSARVPSQAPTTPRYFVAGTFLVRR